MWGKPRPEAVAHASSLACKYRRRGRGHACLGLIGGEAGAMLASVLKARLA